MTLEDVLLDDAVHEFAMDADRIKDFIDDPGWEGSGGYGDWRPYVPGVLRDNWDRLSAETRLALFYVGQTAAQNVNAD